jgi:hypothetical protein
MMPGAGFGVVEVEDGRCCRRHADLAVDAVVTG